MTQSDPRGTHDWHSASYVQEWIPGYDTDERKRSLRRIPHLIPRDPEQPIRVLDIGGGWGPVTLTILDAFPHATIVLHDFSEAMLEEARTRLAGHASAVSFAQGDLMTPAWTANIHGQFDAVVSSLAIHNVRYPDRIRAIYAEIFPLVAPSGGFINLDQVASGELASAAQRHARRMEQRREHFDRTGGWEPLSGLAAAEAPRGPRPQAEASEEHRERMSTSEPATLGNQLRWLLEAGFDDVDCFSRDRGSALLGAYRR